MSGSRERPDVSRRIRYQLDDDLIAGDAVREVAGGDRQLVAPERPREPAPDQAVGAVGANQKAGASHSGGRLDPHAARIERDVGDTDGGEGRARPAGGRQQRGVERGPAGDDKRGRVERDERRTDRPPCRRIAPDGSVTPADPDGRSPGRRTPAHGR